MGIEVILPEGSFGNVGNEGSVADGLRFLTRAIQVSGADISSGCLGGEFGYGADFVNEVFSMFPYYWGDCACPSSWETGDHLEGCPELKPNFEHKKSGLTVDWYKYIGRGMDIDNPNNADWTKVLAECINSIGGSYE